MTEKKKKSVNWDFFKKRCPKCKLTDIKSNKIYRRRWRKKASGRWEIIEQCKYTCKLCNNTWWE